MRHKEWLGQRSGSQVFGAAEAGKDFSHPGLVPVAKRRAEDVPACGPRSPSEYAVLPVEVRDGVSFVRKSRKSRVRLKPRGGPLPYVAEHVFTTIRTMAGRPLTHAAGPLTRHVAVAGVKIGLTFSPRVGALLLPLGIPGGRFFPLFLGW